MKLTGEVDHAPVEERDTAEDFLLKNFNDEGFRSGQGEKRGEDSFEKIDPFLVAEPALGEARSPA